MSKLAHPNCVSVARLRRVGRRAVPRDGLRRGHDAARADRQGSDRRRRARSRSRARSLAGLAHAHEQDVVHRDVKPANIMISEEIGHGERVRILDFGLARLRGNVGRDATQTNIVVGTPNYMAPEQTVPRRQRSTRAPTLRGRRRAVRDDRRRAAVPGRGHAAAARHASRRADPAARRSRARRHRAPGGLQELIDKAMAKSPDDRFQTAIEMASGDRRGDRRQGATRK